MMAHHAQIFASHGVFKKKWDIPGAAKQICAKSTVDCRRLNAAKEDNTRITPQSEEMQELIEHINNSQNL